MCEEKESEHAPLVADDEWDHDGDDQNVLLQVTSEKNRYDKTRRLLRRLCLEVIFVLVFSTIVIVVLYYVHNKPFANYFHEPHTATTNSSNKTGSQTETFSKTAEWTTLISGFGMYTAILCYAFSSAFPRASCILSVYVRTPYSSCHDQ